MRAAVLLLAVLTAVRAPAYAEPLVLEGRIEAAGRAVLSIRVDGVVAGVLFEGGDRVVAGQPPIRLDPTDAPDAAILACRAPHAERLAAPEATGAATVAELLQRVRVRLRLPGGRAYPGAATPHAASAEIDPESGAVTVWARFANPDALLRPGMAVTVLSSIGAPEEDR